MSAKLRRLLETDPEYLHRIMHRARAFREIYMVRLNKRSTANVEERMTEFDAAQKIKRDKDKTHNHHLTQLQRRAANWTHHPLPALRESMKLFDHPPFSDTCDKPWPLDSKGKRIPAKAAKIEELRLTLEMFVEIRANFMFDS